MSQRSKRKPTFIQHVLEIKEIGPIMSNSYHNCSLSLIYKAAPRENTEGQVGKKGKWYKLKNREGKGNGIAIEKFLCISFLLHLSEKKREGKTWGKMFIIIYSPHYWWRLLPVSPVWLDFKRTHHFHIIYRTNLIIRKLRWWASSSSFKHKTFFILISPHSWISLCQGRNYILSLM